MNFLRNTQRILPIFGINKITNLRTEDGIKILQVSYTGWYWSDKNFNEIHIQWFLCVTPYLFNYKSSRGGPLQFINRRNGFIWFGFGISITKSINRTWRKIQLYTMPNICGMKSSTEGKGLVDQIFYNHSMLCILAGLILYSNQSSYYHRWFEFSGYVVERILYLSNYQ